MPFYYAYHVDDDGHVISRVERARLRQVDHDMEVWELDRKVSFLKRPD